MQCRLLASYLPWSRSLLSIRRLPAVGTLVCSDGASVSSSTRLSAWSKTAQAALHQEVVVEGSVAGGAGFRLRDRHHRRFCVGGASSTLEQVSMEDDGIEHEKSAAPGVGLKQQDQQQPLSRDDMTDSYGAGYSTRSSDEGFGQIYGKAAKAVKERKIAREKAEAEEVEQEEKEEDSEVVDPKVHREFDRTQGSHVAQKEAARHSEHANAFEHESAAHRRKEAAKIAND